MEMETALTISKTLLFLALIVLSVYVIITLNKITASIRNIEKELTDVSNGLTPLISETSEVMKDISVLSENIKNDYSKAAPVILDIIDKGKNLSNVVGKITNAVTGVTNSVIPALTGVSTALKFLKK